MSTLRNSDSSPPDLTLGEIGEKKPIFPGLAKTVFRVQHHDHEWLSPTKHGFEMALTSRIQRGLGWPRAITPRKVDFFGFGPWGLSWNPKTRVLNNSTTRDR